MNSRCFMAMLPVYDGKDSTALLRCGISNRPMTAPGLGCVITPGNTFWSPLGRAPLFLADYALIAAMSGWMPMMFMTRVRL